MKRDFPLRGASRRDFIKGVFAASAALGLGPTRAIEMLDEIGGSALAAGAINANRAVHIIGGDGGGAWFTLVWPVPGTITELATNSTVPFDDMNKAGKITSGALEDRSLYHRKVNGSPLWSNFGDKKLVTAMLCGTNIGHETSPKMAGNSNTIPTGTIGSFAASAAIQTTVTSLVPVIGINRNGIAMPYGAATGAPSPAAVPDSNAMINLFSSSASKLMARLSDPNNAKLYEEYYKAFLGLVKTVVPSPIDGVLESVSPVTGKLDTLMAGLACGEVSPLAWSLLDKASFAFMTVPDDAAIFAMKVLAEGIGGDGRIVGGEAGVGGLAGLIAACLDETARQALLLDHRSNILIIGSEGATDPVLYAELVGRKPEEVVAA